MMRRHPDSTLFPYTTLFRSRDRIEARAKTAISSNLDARIDWRKLRLGLLRSFPNLSVQLQDLAVVGVNDFANDTLIAVPRSEEHTSELQSLRHLVCRLLLEK